MYDRKEIKLCLSYLHSKTFKETLRSSGTKLAHHDIIYTFLLQLLGRVLRVDHVENYRQPKESGKEDEATKALRDHGCAPTIQGGSHSSEEEEELFEYDKGASIG